MSELRKKSDPKDLEQPSTTTVFSRASDTELDPPKNPTEDHQQSVTTGERKLSSTCRGTKVCLNLRYETDLCRLAALNCKIVTLSNPSSTIPH